MEKRSAKRWGRNLGIVVLILILMVSTWVVGYVSGTVVSGAKIMEAYDEEDRIDAIIQLTEVKGRVKEIRNLWVTTFSDSEEQKVISELENAVFQSSKNPYLEGFSIHWKASQIGDICDEILLQINEKIHIIKYGTESE